MMMKTGPFMCLLLLAAIAALGAAQVSTTPDTTLSTATSPTSASTASTTASTASTASTTASTESTASTTASTASTTASTASTEASTASTAASTASTEASTASTAASTASTSVSTESTASTPASTVSTSASTVSTSASTGSTSASTGSTSASSRSTASTASTSASTGSTSASTGSTSASTASTSASTGSTVTSKSASATTVSTPPSTNPPSPSEGIVNLFFKLNQTFTQNLSNPSSQAFQILATRVVTQINMVFKSIPSYRRCLVNSFTSGSIATNMTLVFQNSSVTPSANSVVNTLNNSIVVTTLGIMPGSFRASASSGNSSATTVSPPPSTNTPSPTEGFLFLFFKLNQTFTQNLSNPSSQAFQTLATRVVTQINMVYQSIPSFSRSLVNSFTSGSIATNMTLVFTSQALTPSNTSVVNTLNNSAIVTSLGIIPGTIRAQSPTTSGCSRTTTWSLMALPLTLVLLVAQILAFL